KNLEKYKGKFVREID
nr:Chain C, Synthetic peptide [Homo sapiens]